MKLTQRKQYLDIAKGIGIILVVLGHCPQVYNPLKQWIYAFHMPLFFIISGMVWNRESHEKRGFFTRKFVVDKLKRLIIPCYIWGVLYMLLDAVMNRSFSPMNIAYLIYGSQSGFSHAGSLTLLWFLPCMFIATCFFEIIQQILRNQKGRSWILLVISICCTALESFLPKISGGYPWSLDVAFLAIAFMLWGYLGREYVEKMDEKTGLSALIAMVCLAILTLTFQLNLSFVSINNVDMAGRYFGNPLLYLINAVAGSLFVVLIAQMVEKVKKAAETIAYLGVRTIPIFILHKPIVQVLSKVGDMINLHPVLVVVISVPIGIGLSLIVYECVKNISPSVFGEKSKQST